MRCILGSLVLVSLQCFSNAEFYSDVDSKQHDEAKALEIKARDFWQGLMESAEGLETSDNANLCAQIDQALESLPREDNDIRELFHAAMGHLAKADSFLFEQASSVKALAKQRLENGPNSDAFSAFVSEKGAFYVAVANFIGYKTYEKRLAKHIISRLKEVRDPLNRAADVGPIMLQESSEAAKRAHEILQCRDGHIGEKALSDTLRRLALGIVRATGKQRLRFTNYLLGSLLTTAQDLADKNEKPSKTVMKASLRGFDMSTGTNKPAGQSKSPVLSDWGLSNEMQKPIVNSESSPVSELASHIEGQEPTIQIMSSTPNTGMQEPTIQIMSSTPSEPVMRNSNTGQGLVQSFNSEKTEEEPPFMFVDGVPLGATPNPDFGASVKQVVDV